MCDKHTVRGEIVKDNMPKFESPLTPPSLREALLNLSPVHFLSCATCTTTAMKWVWSFPTLLPEFWWVPKDAQYMEPKVDGSSNVGSDEAVIIEQMKDVSIKE
jgi:hypothetical protein